MKIKELESETSQREFADQQNIEADHNSSSSSKDHDFKQYLDMLEKKTNEEKASWCKWTFEHKVGKV